MLPPLRAWFNWRFEGWEHLPPEGPLLIACNHISYMDVFAACNMLTYQGRLPRVLGKAEIFDVPVVGMGMRALKQIPVDRGSGSLAPLQTAVDALDRGETVVVYPEGSVTNRADQLPMKAKIGIGWIALASGQPVVPLAEWGAQDVWQKSGRGKIEFGRPIWMRAGPAMSFAEDAGKTEDHATLRRVTDDVMATLRQMVGDMQAEYPKRWSA